MNHSAIYEGTVRHRRYVVRNQEFTRRLALAYIDLEELPQLLDGRLLRRAKIVRFRRRDYLGEERLGLAEAVRETVASQAGVRPNGPIRLLANLSMFGHCFNPVSFYYCMDGVHEDRLRAVVAEVNNTPWNERHAYVLADRAVEPTQSRRVLRGNFDKQLHVSPFMGMDHGYELRLTAPAETLSVHIASTRSGELVFDATLALRRHDLTGDSLRRLIARYPFNTMRTLAAIYSHAALLKLKGVPVHRHPRESGA